MRIRKGVSLSDHYILAWFAEHQSKAKAAQTLCNDAEITEFIKPLQRLRTPSNLDQKILDALQRQPGRSIKGNWRLLPLFLLPISFLCLILLSTDVPRSISDFSSEKTFSNSPHRKKTKRRKNEIDWTVLQIKNKNSPTVKSDALIPTQILKRNVHKNSIAIVPVRFRPHPLNSRPVVKREYLSTLELALATVTPNANNMKLSSGVALTLSNPLLPAATHAGTDRLAARQKIMAGVLGGIATASLITAIALSYSTPGLLAPSDRLSQEIATSPLRLRGSVSLSLVNFSPSLHLGQSASESPLGSIVLDPSFSRPAAAEKSGNLF